MAELVDEDHDGEQHQEAKHVVRRGVQYFQHAMSKKPTTRSFCVTAAGDGGSISIDVPGCLYPRVKVCGMRSRSHQDGILQGPTQSGDSETYGKQAIDAVKHAAMAGDQIATVLDSEMALGGRLEE